MNQYTVTYVQELSHVVNANTTDMAGVYARKYAHEHKLVVLSVYRVDVEPVALPPAV